MKKWITSNYHYMVPEFDATSAVKPDFGTFLASVQRGIDKVGVQRAVPVVMGPVSMIHFTKFQDTAVNQRDAVMQALVPVYLSLIQSLTDMGIQEIQIHEPALVFDDASLVPYFGLAYPAILPKRGGPRINMVAFMDDVGKNNYQWL